MAGSPFGGSRSTPLRHPSVRARIPRRRRDRSVAKAPLGTRFCAWRRPLQGAAEADAGAQMAAPAAVIMPPSETATSEMRFRQPAGSRAVSSCSAPGRVDGHRRGFRGRRPARTYVLGLAVTASRSLLACLTSARGRATAGRSAEIDVGRVPCGDGAGAGARRASAGTLDAAAGPHGRDGGRFGYGRARMVAGPRDLRCADGGQHTMIKNLSQY